MGDWEGTRLRGGAKVAGHVDLQHSSESARVSVLMCLVHAGVCGPVHMWSPVWFMRLRVELDFLLNCGDWERPETRVRGEVPNFLQSWEPLGSDSAVCEMGALTK